MKLYQDTLTIKTKIMKTKKITIMSSCRNLLILIPVVSILLIAFTSCAARRKATKTQTEILPSPPPPPPAPHQNSVTNDKIKVVTEGVLAESADEPFVIVEEMPMFPGGDSELLRYIGENTKYPENAKKNNIQGRVIIRFCVTAKGNIDRITVLRGADPELDAEALRVVGTLPAFKPGKQGGKEVPVWYMVPITFTLNGGSRFEIIGTDTLYSFTKEMPVFPGGNEAFKKFKTKNVNFPEKLKSLGIEGVVLVRFIVEKNGSVSDVRIINGVSPSLDEEALRVAKLMPSWQPGKENGRPVKSISMTTFEFQLTPKITEAIDENTPFVVVEEMPRFPGGDSALIAYITQNTKYPEVAKANKIEGRVIIRFCVTDAGGIDRVSVLKGVDPELDAEGIRVVKSLPKFKPGKQGGKPVNVWYMVPITFGSGKPSPLKSANIPPKAPPAPQGYDEVAVFKGGETAMYQFINSNLTYPEAAKKNNISGRVNLRFSVGTDGNISDVFVTKSADPALDAEAIRVIKLLPTWTPAKLAGTAVKTSYPVTIVFTLK
jgi:TonB family protein